MGSGLPAECSGNFVDFDASSASPRDSRLQLRLIQQPKQASNVFLVFARMCCVWAGEGWGVGVGVYSWNAGRGN